VKFSWKIFLAIGLFLAACESRPTPLISQTVAAQQTSVQTEVAPAIADTAGPPQEATQTTLPVATDPVTSTPEEQSNAAPLFPSILVGADGGDYPPSNISLIGQTGRLQFLNIFANW